ncbi:TRAP transporter small permease subunit [Lentibacter algarum]|uniref:TRAP transporter small permease subunit n=1 Tax=Lentibacter algarum TaxID=576131 RepID=UPI001C07EE08|nr:TRAP transporter small permease subunit [Lentibacter algarum]MBU2981516.1 TRAP transporter small permease subunit [Lentibacter algarum]
MTATTQISRDGDPALIARMFGWGMLGFLGAFLINNIANIGWQVPNLADVLAGKAGADMWQPIALYVVCVALALAYVVRTPTQALRWDAMKIHRFNTYLIRACFWIVLLIGFADALLALGRVESLFDGVVSDEMVRSLTRSQFVGPRVHLPLVILGALIAFWGKGPAFHWLALLIVSAELAIVLSRFVFSYEQALMGDLVRYWYAALFLFASAYTLFEDGHVRVDVFYAGFGRTKKGFVNAWGSIFLGMATMWVIIWIGLGGKQSIINSPVMNIEITQSGPTGMYVKYQMAAFLGVFAITMLIQFVSYFLESVADKRDEPGQRTVTPTGH